MEEERRSPAGLAIIMIGAVLILAGLGSHSSEVLGGGGALIVLGIILAIMAL
jgi:hypothetical protein